VATVGQHGVVLGVAGESADVQVRALKVKVPLGRLGPAREGESPRAAARAEEAQRREAAARREEERREGARREPAPSEGGGVRLPGNTCDLRGKRLEEAEAEVERFVGALLGRGERFGYLLHGHGTGVLKSGLRTWLRSAPFVRGFRPGDLTEGGDAFTVVEL